MWIGKQLGLTEEAVDSAVHTLCAHDLLHVRDLPGFLMVHPTAKALVRPSGVRSFLLGLIRGLTGNR